MTMSSLVQRQSERQGIFKIATLTRVTPFRDLSPQGRGEKGKLSPSALSFLCHPRA